MPVGRNTAPSRSQGGGNAGERTIRWGSVLQEVPPASSQSWGSHSSLISRILSIPNLSTALYAQNGSNVEAVRAEITSWRPSGHFPTLQQGLLNLILVYAYGSLRQRHIINK